jgi:cation diffusion facilitator family transporter
MPSAAAPEDRDQQVRRVLLVILLLNLVVVAIKIGVGVGTRSLAVFGDALQASLDAVTNLLGLAIVAVASKGPDAEHPYGHAKFETLGALIIVVFLSVSLFELLRGAAARLLQGTPAPTATPGQFGLLAATLLINVLVTLYESREGRRLDSELLLADAEHTRMDVLITLAVIGGLGLSALGLDWADPILAVVVALFVARAGYAIVRRAIPTLVDERAYDENRIRERAVEIPGVTSAYAIRSRAAAQVRFAELTIAVDGASDVTSAHRIADAVEQHLKDTLELHEVMVHVEPC